MAFRFEIDLRVRRRALRFHESRPSRIALEASEFLRRNDHDLIAPVNRNVLWTFGVYPPHELAESRLCVLKEPVSGCALRGRSPASFSSGALGIS